MISFSEVELSRVDLLIVIVSRKRVGGGHHALPEDRCVCVADSPTPVGDCCDADARRYRKASSLWSPERRLLQN